MGVFPDFDSNVHAQFWIVARYMESGTFLLAPLFFDQNFEPVLMEGSVEEITGYSK